MIVSCFYYFKIDEDWICTCTYVDHAWKTHGIILILCKLLLIAKNLPFFRMVQNIWKKKHPEKLFEAQGRTAKYMCICLI